MEKKERKSNKIKSTAANSGTDQHWFLYKQQTITTVTVTNQFAWEGKTMHVHLYISPQSRKNTQNQQIQNNHQMSLQ